MKKLQNINKTLFVLSFGMMVSCAIAFLLQNKANKSVNSCSYLDPIIVDILAVIMAAFLITEGIIDIFSHRNSQVKSQLSRCFRVCLGVSIMTIHVMQFIHK